MTKHLQRSDRKLLNGRLLGMYNGCLRGEGRTTYESGTPFKIRCLPNGRSADGYTQDHADNEGNQKNYQ